MKSNIFKKKKTVFKINPEFFYKSTIIRYVECFQRIFNKKFEFTVRFENGAVRVLRNFERIAVNEKLNKNSSFRCETQIFEVDIRGLFGL